jgi:hypothetical protein
VLDHGQREDDRKRSREICPLLQGILCAQTQKGSGEKALNRSKVLVCASNARHLEHFHLPYLQVFRESGWTVHTAAQGALLSASADKKYDLAFQKRLLSFQNLFTILRLAGILKRERYGLICVHTTLAAAICRIALLLSGLRDTKLVYTCHGYFFGADESGKISKDLRSLFLSYVRAPARAKNRFIAADEPERLCQRPPLQAVQKNRSLSTVWGLTRQDTAARIRGRGRGFGRHGTPMKIRLCFCASANFPGGKIRRRF